MAYYLIVLQACHHRVFRLCRKLGCERIWLTDHDSRSLAHMTKDIFTNDIEAEVIALNWFDFDMSTFAANTFFSENKLRIVAGDVLYKNELLVPFFTVVSSILGLSDSKMLLCHVPRAGVEQETVTRTAAEFGLQVSAIDPAEWRKGVCLMYSVPEDYNRAQLYEIFKP